MNMNDPRLAARIESSAMEARILGQNPRMRRRSPLKSMMVTLLVLIALIVAVVIWMGSMTINETYDPSAGQAINAPR